MEFDTGSISSIENLEGSSAERDDQNTQSPPSLTQLSDAKTNPLRTLYIEYTNDLPEYPRTDPDGYTYVVRVSSQSQEEAEHLCQDIQYSRASIHGAKKNIKSSFLNCSVKKYAWRCSGALTCEFLKPSLRQLHHTYIDEATWGEIREIRSTIEVIEKDICKRNAFSLYRSRKSYFRRQEPCFETLPSCRLTVKQEEFPDVNGEYRPYIACVNETIGFLQRHYRGSIQGHTSVDLEFLEQLFNNSILPSQEECGVIEPLTSRRKYCDYDHIQGPGKLEHQKCSVVFTALVPSDIKINPYIIFTSHGIHQHPPPPPHKPPELIMKGIQNIIRQMRNPSLTLSQFLRSPELEALCQQYNASSPAEIHASLSNTDRISAVIQKQRLLIYPAGQRFDGVIYLYNTDPFVKEYIQEKYHDPKGIMILCAFPEQIKLLAKLSSFEIDMAYKRIRDKKTNEVLFATYLHEHGKIITLLRVFTDQATTEGYYLLFKRVFTLIQKITGYPVQFNSIHSSGIYAIIADMDSKQYTGLGQYLQEIDPQQRPILWQLQGTIIFCRVHFFRSITQIVGKDSAVWGRMAGLIDCKSEDDYDQLCDLLITYEEPKIQNWAEQKKQPVIKAGLNKNCSRIPAFIYDSIRNHTNSAEQSHNKSNAAGKQLTLTEAIRNSAKLDKQDILQYINRTNLGIHHSYRTANMETNYIRHMQREETRKRQRSSSILSPGNEELARISYSQASVSNRSMSSSSRGASRATKRNTVSFEQQRQVLELREVELRLKNQEEEVKEKQLKNKEKEEEIREKQLKNEEKELELIERRARIQEGGN